MSKILQLFRFISILLFISIMGNNAYANRLINAQVVSKEQIVFQLLESPRYHTFNLSNPERFVIDFDQTSLACSLNHLYLGNLPVRSIRTSIDTKKTLRVVLDLKSKQYSRIQLFPASPGKPYRFSVTFTPKASSSSTVSSVRRNTNKPAKKVTAPVHSSSPAVLHTKATYQPKKVVIIIDAGHGGKDPGAHGVYGTREKNVVLGIARQLGNLINKQPGMRAVLTRKGDYYIDLRQRLILARKNSGDLFVSIHADAFSNRHSHGASVFALSEKGGTSEAARWLAAKENYSELGGVNLNGLDDKNGMVRSVLIDLSETATIGASLELGSGVLNSMGKVTPLHHRRVEQAQFVVLKSLDIPSILIETGFISNPQEEKNLRNPAYQAKLAKAILQGIQFYLAQHPPVGSTYWVKK
jgi:N-acetylmuramoyl-L-alanine amidase